MNAYMAYKVTTQVKNSLIHCVMWWANQEASVGILEYSCRVRFSSVAVCFRPRCRCSVTRPSPWGDASATSSGSTRSFPKNTDQMDSSFPHHRRRAFWVGSHELLLALPGWSINLSHTSWRMGWDVVLSRNDEGEGGKGGFILCRLCWEKTRRFGEVGSLLWRHGQKPLAALRSHISSCCPGDVKLKGSVFPCGYFYLTDICSGWSITHHCCRTLMSESSWKEKKYAKITPSLMDEIPSFFPCSSQFYRLFEAQCGHSCFIVCVCVFSCPEQSALRLWAAPASSKWSTEQQTPSVKWPSRWTSPTWWVNKQSCC